MTGAMACTCEDLASGSTPALYTDTAPFNKEAVLNAPHTVVAGRAIAPFARVPALTDVLIAERIDVLPIIPIRITDTSPCRVLVGVLNAFVAPGRSWRETLFVLAFKIANPGELTTVYATPVRQTCAVICLIEMRVLYAIMTVSWTWSGAGLFAESMALPDPDVAVGSGPVCFAGTICGFGLMRVADAFLAFRSFGSLAYLALQRTGADVDLT
jgi:hypothetical protein